MRLCRWTLAGLLLLFVQVVSSPVSPADAQMRRLLSAEPGPAAAGATVRVQVVWLNDADPAGRAEVPDRIPCTISNAGRRFQGELRIVEPRDAGERAIAPGRFLQVDYRLDLPAGLDGQAALLIEDRAEAVFSVEKAAALPPPAAEEKKPLPRAYFAENIYGYEPLYFLYGPEPRNARFQFSLKYRILDTAEPPETEGRVLRGLFFGYTQTSLWDLESASKPFEDTSYKPELFYLRQDLPISPGAGIKRVDFQTGVQHESNGRAGPESRSLNIAYVRPTLVFGDPEQYHFTVSAKLWTYIGDLSENPDIYRYRGYFDLYADYGSFDGWKLASIFRKGTEGSNGSVQLDLTYPLNRSILRSLDFFLHAQFFSGYGETLLNYDRYDTRFRIGFSVYR